MSESIPRKRGSTWDENSLKLAMEAVQNNQLNTNAAALKFNIPRRTLRNHLLKGNSKKIIGKTSVLSKQLEEDLSQQIKRLAELGIPLTPEFIRKQAFLFCERYKIKHSFNITTGMAGRKWLKMFLVRNPSILKSKTPLINPPSAEEVSKSIEDHHFENVKSEEFDIIVHPERLYNMEEKGPCITDDIPNVVSVEKDTDTKEHLIAAEQLFEIKSEIKEEDSLIQESEDFFMQESEDSFIQEPEDTFVPDAEKTTIAQLPEKSKKAYDVAYHRFLKWCNDEDIINDFSEKVLIAYFTHLSQTLKGSSLWSHYSMMKIQLQIKHNTDMQKYTSLQSFIKQKNKGIMHRKSNILSKEQVDTFIRNAPNLTYLASKVLLIFGIHGACRCEELLNLTTADIADMDVTLLVNLRKTNTAKARSFTITGATYINLYREYYAMRPKSTKNDRFFIKYVDGRCHNAVMGIHKIAQVPKQVATFLKLDDVDNYTGHCLRSSSATILLDNVGSNASLEHPNITKQICSNSTTNLNLPSASRDTTKAGNTDTIMIPETSIRVNMTNDSTYNNSVVMQSIQSQISALTSDLLKNSSVSIGTLNINIYPSSNA